MIKTAIVGALALALAGCVESQDDPTWANEAIAATPPSNLARGMAFPLSSGTVARLSRVDVQWITATRTVEVTVLLDPLIRNTESTLEDLLDYGEFCLRYGRLILQDAAPLEQQPLISLMAVVYQRSPTERTTRASDLGFGFVVWNGYCTLTNPYPSNLVPEAQRRALQAFPLPDDET